MNKKKFREKTDSCRDSGGVYDSGYGASHDSVCFIRTDGGTDHENRELPEPMLIRSVLREVGHRREEILAGPAVGRDCAVMEPREGEVLRVFLRPYYRHHQRIWGNTVFILLPMI